MELKSISSEEFTAMYNASYEPKRKVDKVDVRSIVSEFFTVERSLWKLY